MKKLLKSGGSLVILAGFAAALTAQPAAAQDAAAIQSIQQQIQQLQSQLKKLQVDAARRDIELKKAQDDAAQARAAAAASAASAAAVQATPLPAALSVPSTVLPGSAIATIPPNDKDASGAPVFNAKKPNGSFNIGGITVTLGGYIDLTALERTRNENAGVATSFASGIPFPNSPNYRTGELRATAQQSRFSVLLTGNPYDGAQLSAYAETDLQSAGSSSNSQQTNSYTLRVRQAYVQFDDSNDNLHFLGGQAWSLLTPFKSGLTPRAENVPPVLENSIVQGFAYARQPQLRVSTSVGNVAFFGVSLEAPQTTFGGTKPTIANESLQATSVTYTGATPAVNTGTVASGGLNPITTYSYNTLPDLIAKVAIEPGFGHYELYGIARSFKDEKITGTTVATFDGSSGDATTAGGGIGASAFVSLVPGLIDVSGNVLAGYGIGRYGSAGLPDATYKANGAPQPLPEIEAMLGVIGHVTPALDLFAYGGTEQEGRKFGGTGASGYGYGNPTATNFSNADCGVINNAAAPGACTANTKAATGIQVGAWYTALRGGFGTLKAGVSYQYDKREVFDNKLGGAPTTDENVFLVTVRYSPFQ